MKWSALPRRAAERAGRLPGDARVNAGELRSGLGLEGLWAGTTMAIGASVQAIGIFALVEKWPMRPPGPVTFRLTAVGRFVDEIGLPWFWVLFVGAVALAGWWLSGQVSKRWLRVFVGLNVVIAGLLVVAVGRNARVDASNDAAATEARQLATIVSERRQSLGDGQADPGRAEAAERLDAAAALVGCLADLGRAGQTRGTCGLIATGDVSTDSETISTQSLTCLPGWTLGAFGEWLGEASYDRKVVSLTAVARCELNAFDPGSELGEVAAAESPDIVVDAGESGDPTGSPPAVEKPGDDLATSDQDRAAIDARVDQDALQRAAIDARTAVNEALGTQRTETTLYEAIIDGSDGILATISGPTDFVEFRFSGATWILILGLALLWYRKLEIRAGSQSLGPVDIVSEGAAATLDPSSNSDGKEATESPSQSAGHAIFKQAVVQNVPEPGAVPGAQALAPVGDLVASSEVRQKKLIGGLVELLQTIFATRSGYVVVFSSHLEHETQAGGNGTETNVAFVRIRDRRTGQQLASMRFASEYLEEAAQLAGYWVAGWIISRSRHVPTWAKWSENDARSFYSLQWRQGDDLPLHTRGRLDATAIDQTSVNSLILAQRAYAHQICAGGGGPYTFNALEDFARAVNRKPRYPVARYRRAAALSALMDSRVRLECAFHDGTGERRLPSKSRFRHLFGDQLSCDRDQVESWIEDVYSHDPERRSRFPEPMRREMLAKVTEWAADGRAGVRAGVVARLRPSERQFWRDFSRAGVRSDWMKLISTSDDIAEQRLPGARPGPSPAATRRAAAERVERRANAPDSHWQISYNLACLHALRADGTDVPNEKNREVDTAFAWLERCLDRPHSRQLVREWAERDPDLAALRPPHAPGVEHAKEWERWIRRVPRLPVLIRFGDENQSVRQLQTQLDLLDPTNQLVIDGRFGPETAEAIRRFQRAQGLGVDGHADAKTLAELEVRYDDHVNRIAKGLRSTDASLPDRDELLDETGHLTPTAVETIRRYQTRCGVVGDGLPGPLTVALLESATDPDRLRELLGACASGGRLALTSGARRPPVTTACIRAFQSGAGLAVDGVPGPKTIEALASCRRGRPQRPFVQLLLGREERAGRS